MSDSLTKEFDSFVKGQQAANDENLSIDWNAERERWLRDLKALYEKIESFLASYLKSGEIAREYQDHPLNEENIGSYTAQKMILRIGRKEIALTPVGTLLIGARGRVDVVGPAGSTRLMLVNRNATGSGIKVTVTESGKRRTEGQDQPKQEIQWDWKIVTNPPTMQFIELTQETLFQALLEVANG